MSEPEVVEAYLHGKIAAWTFVRRLLKGGLSLGTAIAFAAALPAAARGGDHAALDRLVETVGQENPEEAAVLERLMRQIAQNVVPLEQGGNPTPLGRSLVRVGLNVVDGQIKNADLNFNSNVGNTPVFLSGNVQLNESFVNDPDRVEAKANSLALFISGNVGNLPLVLDGSINVNVNGVEGPAGVNLNIGGNLGDMKLNFNDRGK